MTTYYHNSLGANPADGYMYFTGQDTIYRLDANCHQTPLCDVNFTSYCGTFDRKGNYWISDFNTGLLYAFDVNTCNIVKGPFTLPETVADIAFNLFDCHLYMVGANSVYKMDTLGNIVSTSYYGSGPNGLGTPGGLTIGADNQLYAMQGAYLGNVEGGYFYRVTNDQFDPSLLITWTNNNGPTLNSRTDLATFPCFDPKIDPKIIADKVSGCWPLRVSFYGEGSSTPNPNGWKWDFGDGSPLLDTSNYIEHVFWKPGVYQVKLIASLVSDCNPTYSESTTITITVENKPSVFLYSPVESICAGDKVELKAYGLGSYSWSTGQAGPNITVQPSSTTTYIVTGSNGNNGCDVSDTVSIQVDQKPIIYVTPATICKANTNAILEVSGADYFKWSDGFEGFKRGVSPSVTTKYLITGYNSSNCYDTASVSVTVMEDFVPKIISNKTEFCQGDSLHLQVNGLDYVYWIYPNNGYSSYNYVDVAPLTYADTGYYYVSGYYQSCYVQSSIQIQIKNNAQLTLSAHQFFLCEGDELKVVAQTVPANASLAWSGPNGFMSNSNLLHWPTVALSDSGTYRVESSLGDCKAQDSISVSIADYPDSTLATAATGPYCSQEGFHLWAVEGYVYSWTGPQGFTSDSSAVNKVPASTSMSGIYAVTITGKNGCVSHANKLITILESPQVSLQSSPFVGICEGEDFDLQVKVSPPNASVTWTGPNSYSSTGQSHHFSQASSAETGVYYVIGTFNGCSTKDSVSVIIDNRPDSTIYVLDNKDTICEQGQGDIELYYTNPYPHQISWYKVGDISSVGSNDQLFLNQPAQTGSYYAIVNSAYSFCLPQKTNVEVVKIYQMPTAIFSQNEMTVNYSPGLKIPIPLVSVGAGVDSVTFLGWSPTTWLYKGDTLFPTIVPQPHQKIIDYTITLKSGKNGAECISSYVFHFFNKYPVIVPNAFSPNQDNLNDVWVIQGLDWFPSSRLYVYNRWGNKVFENEDGYKEPWDGKYHGKEMPNGTYYYILELKGSQDFSDHQLSGSITIVR
jgi:gliding motility-associated-like protein